MPAVSNSLARRDGLMLAMLLGACCASWRWMRGCGERGSKAVDTFSHFSTRDRPGEHQKCTVPNRWLVPNALQNANLQGLKGLSHPSQHGSQRWNPAALQVTSHTKRAATPRDAREEGFWNCTGLVGYFSGKPKRGRGRGRVVVRKFGEEQE